MFHAQPPDTYGELAALKDQGPIPPDDFKTLPTYSSHESAVPERIYTRPIKTKPNLSVIEEESTYISSVGADEDAKSIKSEYFSVKDSIAEEFWEAGSPFSQSEPKPPSDSTTSQPNGVDEAGTVRAEDTQPDITCFNLVGRDGSCSFTAKTLLIM